MVLVSLLLSNFLQCWNHSKKRWDMSCKRCHIKRACQHLGGWCPWVFYAFLLTMVSIPAFLIFQG